MWADLRFSSVSFQKPGSNFMAADSHATGLPTPLMNTSINYFIYLKNVINPAGMTKQDAIKLFEEKKVRTVWDSDREEWFFSIVDVIAVLTEQPTHQGARNYWKVLKNRISKEGNEPVTNCNRLKLPAEDGKMRFTDVAGTEQLFRLIQSIPSPKAEPFKMWMAQVAKERLDQMQDPELSIEQAMWPGREVQ